MAVHKDMYNQGRNMSHRLTIHATHATAGTVENTRNGATSLWELARTPHTDTE